VAVVVGVATSFFTGSDGPAWWVAGVFLVAAGVAVQLWLPQGSSAEGRERGQKATGNTVGGSLLQHMDGPGRQEAEGNQVTGDLTQRQDG
jgi:hypothetical protein